MNSEIIENFGMQFSRIINSIKHTPESFSKAHHLDLNKINRVIEGIDIPDKKLLDILKNHKVINFNDFLKNIKSDQIIPQEIKRIEIKMSSQESFNTTRTFSRGISDNKFEYYHYSDLAASKFTSFLPEHIVPIQDTKNLIDKYGEIPDWAFNKGHLEHQITYFSGEIDFHWIVNGKKYSRIMNDGEMNYIFPYTPHTFTTRSYGSYIAAVTYKSFINSPIGLDLISNTKQKKGESLFDCLEGESYCDEIPNEYIIFLPSIKLIKFYSLLKNSLSPYIKYDGHIFPKDAEINERWTYFIKPPLKLETKSISDINFQKTIGKSFVSNHESNDKILNEEKLNFIQIGLKRPKKINLYMVKQEVKSFYKMHGIEIINRLISDNSKWF